MTDLKAEIYKHEKIFERAKDRLQKNKKLTIKQRNNLLEFIDHCRANNLSIHRMIMYLGRVSTVGEILGKEFRAADNKDMKRVFAALHARKYAQNTISTYQKLTKCFYRWLLDLDSNEAIPCFKGIRGVGVVTNIQREDLLTSQDIENILRSTKDVQYRALISCLFFGALRPGELLNMSKADVSVNGDHIKLTVRGKMESKMGSRDVFINENYDTIVNWLEVHPGGKSLWQMKDRKGKLQPMSLKQLSDLTKRLGKAAYIKKNCFPYIFRHSRAVQLYIKYGEAIAKKMMGHSPNSSMAKVYSHLTDDDVLKALRGDVETVVQKDTVCPRCKVKNIIDANVCKDCKWAFRQEAIKPDIEERIVTKVLDVLVKQGAIQEVKNP